MSRKIIDSPKVFKNIIGESLGTTNWKEVTQKEIDSFAAATEDLYTYMQTNKPQSGISQQRPTFTNIDNGIGIFTSRYNHYIENLQLSEATHQGLSIELSDLNFIP